MERNRFLLLLAIIQIVAIIYLSFTIYQRQQQVLKRSNLYINPIRKGSLVFSPSKELKRFFEPKANIIDQEFLDHESRRTINKDSLNERFDYSIEKKKGVYRIITLGCSFTYGVGVDTKNNWTELLEDMLNKKLSCSKIKKFEVINLGVGGYDFQYSLERFKKRGIKYHPDLLIWYMVDPLRMTERTSDPVNVAKSEKECAKENDKNRYCSWRIGRNNTIADLGEENILKFQQSILFKSNKYYYKPLVLAIDDNFSNYQKSFFKKYIKERGKDSWLESIYIPKKNKFPDNGHPNERGHKQIAEDMFKFLVSHKSIPCN